MTHDFLVYLSKTVGLIWLMGFFVIVVIRDEESDGVRPLGGASRWWWHHSLAALETASTPPDGPQTDPAADAD